MLTAPALHPSLTRAIRSQGALLIVAGAVFVLAVGSISLTGRPNEIAVLWPANAVILAALLKSRRTRWIHFFAAGIAALFLANLVSRIDLLFSAALVGCNAIEILICDRCMRRFGGPGFDLTKPRTLAAFLISAGILGPVASAGGAAVVYFLADNAPFLESFVRWYAPDALGLIAITPALLSLRRRSLVTLRRGVQTRYGLGALLVFAICLTMIATNERGALLFLMPVALLLVAITLDTAGAALALLVTSVVMVSATYAGFGVIDIREDGPHDSRLLVLQTFLASLTFVILPVGAALAERRRLESRLRSALAKEEHLVRTAREDRRASLLAQHIAGVGHWRRDLRSGANTWSDEMFVIHGLDDLKPRDLVAGATRSLYDPADYQKMQAAVERAISTGERFQLAAHLTRANDGERRSVLFLGDVERDVDGQICAVIGVMRDTTAEIAAKTALEESEARYRLLADTASDVVLKFGPDNRFRYVSPPSVSFSGAPKILSASWEPTSSTLRIVT